MNRSTVLVLLFADSSAHDQLDNFLASIHNGLKGCPKADAPQVHVFYRRDSDAARHYELTANATSPLPPNPCTPATQCAIYTGSMHQQLRCFLKAVRGSVNSNTGPVYVMIGAHGKMPSGIWLIPTILMLLSLMIFAFNPRKRSRIYQNWWNLVRPTLPPGAAIRSIRGLTVEFLKLTELNRLLARFLKEKPPKTLVLHSCTLSSIEAIYELQCTEQIIACEDNLSGSMDASPWFPFISAVSLLGNLSQAASGNATQGIFTSCVASNAPKYIQSLNHLGSKLSERLHIDKDSINTARDISSVLYSGPNCPAVDLWCFCKLLSQKPEFSAVCSRMQCDVIAIQKWDPQSPVHQGGAASPPKNDYQGISVFLPERDFQWKVKELPAGFFKAADKWVDFLKRWSPPKSP